MKRTNKEISGSTFSAPSPARASYTTAPDIGVFADPKINKKDFTLRDSTRLDIGLSSTNAPYSSVPYGSEAENEDRQNSNANLGISYTGKSGYLCSDCSKSFPKKGDLK